MNEQAVVQKVDPYQLMDLMDDAAIIEEIKGRISKAWAYNFRQGNEDVWGLSKVGVDACCREMAKMGEVIREDGVDYGVDPTDDRYILFKASATRYAVNKNGEQVMLDSAYGTKRQCRLIVTSREGVTDRENNFWFEQGAMKALRNARARLISEEVRAQIMSLAKEGGKVAQISEEVVEGAVKPPQPPPQPQPAAQASPTGRPVCPQCGQPAIIKGKEEYGGGWLCWKKEGGCGAKFDSDPLVIVEEDAEPAEEPLTDYHTALDALSGALTVEEITIVFNDHYGHLKGEAKANFKMAFDKKKIALEKGGDDVPM
ncbi:hypothetical protein LCGC14_0338220 [marine sediment metagenome]|uniref:Uncharacterized protein n=1 Tax=marine sediment metagenome TaxID=412755 RepID=A0A0F9WM01_9ZZZZ